MRLIEKILVSETAPAQNTKNIVWHDVKNNVYKYFYKGKWEKIIDKNLLSQISQLQKDIQDLSTEVTNKVDKVEGKDLSTNDYINDDKALVGTISSLKTKGFLSLPTNLGEAVEVILTSIGNGNYQWMTKEQFEAYKAEVEEARIYGRFYIYYGTQEIPYAGGDWNINPLLSHEVPSKIAGAISTQSPTNSISHSIDVAEGEDVYLIYPESLTYKGSELSVGIFANEEELATEDASSGETYTADNVTYKYVKTISTIEEPTVVVTFSWVEPEPELEPES